MKNMLVALALVLSVGPALAEPVSLAALSDYFNQIRTAETRFTQLNADGSVSEGRLLIERPGRMRFEYAGDDTLVLASGGQVAVFDGKSNQPPEQYPLKRTPLNVILARRVDLAQARMVVDHGEEAGRTYVVAMDPENPESGTIRLYFAESPVALTEWVITDDAGQDTRVTLGPLTYGESYPPSTFSINFEVSRRGL